MDTVDLPRGGNTSIQSALQGANNILRLDIIWAGDGSQTPSCDALAFCLGENGKIRQESDMLFYNNRSACNGAVVLSDLSADGKGGYTQSFRVFMNQITDDVARVVFCMNIDTGLGSVLSVSQLKKLNLTLVHEGKNAALATCTINVRESQTTAIILAELYRRNNEWKIKSVGQGYDEGLSALAEGYGVVVADAAQGASAQSPSASISTMPHLNRENLTHVLSAALVPGSATEMRINLVWGDPSQPHPDTLPASAQRKTLIGSLLGRSSAKRSLDLDLCCLYELKDGYRGIVQALGNKFGAFASAPYVELMGDEGRVKSPKPRSAQQVETLRINGVFWHEVNRLLVFAMIFEGMPDWKNSMGKASIIIPDHPPVSVRLDECEGKNRTCSIALIENVDGKIVINKCLDTYKNPRELDVAFGWGLRWTAGLKD